VLTCWSGWSVFIFASGLYCLGAAAGAFPRQPFPRDLCSIGCSANQQPGVGAKSSPAATADPAAIAACPLLCAVPAGPSLPSHAGGLDLTRDDDDARLLEDLGASQPDPAAAAGTAWEATRLVWGCEPEVALSGLHMESRPCVAQDGNSHAHAACKHEISDQPSAFSYSLCHGLVQPLFSFTHACLSCALSHLLTHPPAHSLTHCVMQEQQVVVSRTSCRWCSRRRGMTGRSL
jgi:hypothetical protein